METKKFLDQLDRLTFVSHENKTLQTNEGFEVSYNLELMGGVMTNYPIQFIFRIRKGDVYIATWGCSSNEDNALATSWWLKKCYALDQMWYE
jgi:hypothetical protein